MDWRSLLRECRRAPRDEGFPAGDERDNHEKGWTAILDKLEAEFSGTK